METALQVELATAGSTQQFNQFADSYVGSGRVFSSAILWELDGVSWRTAAIVGAPPLLAPNSEQAHSVVSKAVTSPTFAVTFIQSRGSLRIGYAVANPKNPTIVIYAERAIPANRVVPVESNSAFSDLDFATYLGPTTNLSALTTTDLPLRELPLSGNAMRVSIPFGDSTITLVAAPRTPLGGTLGGVLPLIFVVGGALLTIGTAIVTYQLVHRRRSAEQDAATIADLFEQLDGLYGEQHSIADSLQQALLPQHNPAIHNLEIVTRYLAGADGVEIGGDWFSAIELDGRGFGFVVGDVSGKGVGAAAIMARLRFTVRAYLVEGHPPEVVLGMCSRQLNVTRDGHLSTLLVGVGNVDSGVIKVANAGHLNPLIISDSGVQFAETSVGLPLGVGASTYTATTIPLTSGSTLVAFTDGLIERRTESIDAGLERLARAATTPAPTLDDLVSNLTSTVANEGLEDDIAVLAFRWSQPG
jgi:serine phosphatase RsbU (regulator of sigma subunit)